MAVKLTKTSSALEDIKKNFPERIMAQHEPMDAAQRSSAYLRRLYGGPRLEDFISVAVDISFTGDPPRFVIEGILYTLYERIGPLRDNIESFCGIQKTQAKRYIK
jgi:hypothetical protein